MLTEVVLLAFPRFAPGTAPASAAARRDVELLWAALATGLLYYSMSGLLKMVGIAKALWLGDLWLLDPRQPPKQLVAVALSGKPARLSAWVLDHPTAAKLGYFFAVALELGSFVAAFQRRLLRPWVATLAVFHVATLLTLRILFAKAAAMLALWALLGPFPRPLTAPRRQPAQRLPAGSSPRPGAVYDRS